MTLSDLVPDILKKTINGDLTPESNDKNIALRVNSALGIHPGRDTDINKLSQDILPKVNKEGIRDDYKISLEEIKSYLKDFIEKISVNTNKIIN